MCVCVCVFVSFFLSFLVCLFACLVRVCVFVCFFISFFLSLCVRACVFVFPRAGFKSAACLCLAEDPSHSVDGNAACTSCAGLSKTSGVEFDTLHKRKAKPLTSCIQGLLGQSTAKFWEVKAQGLLQTDSSHCLCLCCLQGVV